MPKGRVFEVSIGYQVLRVCERLGGCMSPAELERLPPRDLARLLAYDEIRRAEENARNRQ